MHGRGRWNLIAAAVLLWVALVVPKLFQHASANTADLDTGNYHHLAWGIGALGPADGFASSVLTRHHLGEHCSPVMMLVALPYLVWPSAYVLMLLQATAVWVTIVVTLSLARDGLRDAGVEPVAARVAGLTVLLVMLLVWPPLTATLATQFQPIELGAPLIAASLWLIHRGRVGWLWLTVPLLLSTRESATLAVVGLGLFAGIGHGRWRLAGVLVVAGVGWAIIAMKVLMPYFRAGAEWGHTSYIDPLAAWDEKGQYLAVLLLGLGLFPWIGRIAVAAAVGALPGILLNISVDRAPQYGFAGHYDAKTVPFLMIAAAVGIGTFAKWCDAKGQPKGERFSQGIYAASLTLSLVLFGIAGTKTVWQRLDDWWPSADRRATIAEAKAMAERYRDAPGMTAHHRIGPHVAHRPNYIAERAGRTKEKWVWFISTRIGPGHVFLIPREDNVFVKSGFPGQVRRSGSSVLLERGDYVEMWQWPLDAPPPNNDAASRAYAAWLHEGDDVERSDYDP